MDAKSRVWHWHDATKPNLAGYSPQVKQSWSRNLCFFKWWVLGDVLGRILVRSTSGPLLSLVSHQPSAGYRKTQPKKAKNPEILALFSRLPWTNQQNAMWSCNLVYGGNTRDIGVLHVNLKSCKNRCQAANCSFSPGPRSTAICVANVHLWIQHAIRNQFLREQKDLVPFWLHKFIQVSLLIICSQQFFWIKFR